MSVKEVAWISIWLELKHQWQFGHVFPFGGTFISRDDISKQHRNKKYNSSHLPTYCSEHLAPISSRNQVILKRSNRETWVVINPWLRKVAFESALALKHHHACILVEIYFLKWYIQISNSITIAKSTTNQHSYSSECLAPISSRSEVMLQGSRLNNGC